MAFDNLAKPIDRFGDSRDNVVAETEVCLTLLNGEATKAIYRAEKGTNFLYIRPVRVSLPAIGEYNEVTLRCELIAAQRLNGPAQMTQAAIGEQGYRRVCRLWRSAPHGNTTRR